MKTKLFFRSYTAHGKCSLQQKKSVITVIMMPQTDQKWKSKENTVARLQKIWKILVLLLLMVMSIQFIVVNTKRDLL